MKLADDVHLEITLKIFAMARVKLDVYDNRRNSLISIANAMNAPQVSLNAKVRPVGASGSTLTESDNCHNASPIEYRELFKK